MGLEAKNVTFYYRGRKKEACAERRKFKDSPGERVGLKAPSGRGKTTLCRLLAGYEKPKKGRSFWTGGLLGNTRGSVRCR